jgi:hypothetical protein
MGVLLVSEKKLKAYTNINRNVDQDILKSELQITQDIDLQTILGTKFYKHLMAQVTITGDTFTNEEKILVDEYIAPYMIQTAYFNAIPFIMYRTMNNGIVSGTQENATAVDAGTVAYLRNIQKQRSDFYLQRLMDYLLIGYGQNQFPDYVTQSTRDGMIPDRSQKYMNGISLKKTTRKGYSLKDVNNPGSRMYSELMNENPPCQDCY